MYITDLKAHKGYRHSHHAGLLMATPSLHASIAKLAIAGEQAGFTVEQMIQMLTAGVAVEGLLRLIEWRLSANPEPLRSSRWVC